jgi:predicted Rossmann fold nucleotide-binding protein DprA/Smf involved in DNA uptake
MTTIPASADAQATALACTTLAAGRGGSLKPLTPTDWTGLSGTLAKAEMQPRELIGLDAPSLEERLEIAPEPAARLAALMSRGGQLGLELERLASLGIWIISQADDAYPEDLRSRLGRTAPPVLFGSGPRSPLNERGIAVVGSRDADDDALAYASRLGALCASQGFTTVSGAARGIDITAMLGSIEAGGNAVGITVDPLERLVRRTDLRAAIADEQLTLTTPFHPGARWHQGNAMRRNRLIYAVADAAVVVTTAAGSGGTWAGAIEDLKAGWVPLHVREDDAPGNRLLISEGGRPLTGSSSSLEEVKVASLTESRQGTLPTEPSPPPRPSVEDPPASAFEAVWPLMFVALERPRKEKEVAELLELQPGQARAWLLEAVERGLLEVSKRPKLYSLVGQNGDAAQLHLAA